MFQPLGKTRTSIRWVNWSATAAMTVGLLLGTLTTVTAQPQPSPSVEQKAALEEANRLLQQVKQLHKQNKYSDGIPLLERVLALMEKAMGRENSHVVPTLNLLATVYTVQGNYQKAEPLLLRAIEIREKTLGKEHPDVAPSLDSLGELYLQQGNYQKAEPLLTRALAIREKAPGKEQLDVADSLNTLAHLYFLQGNYQKAELLLQRALEIREKALGKENPDLISIFNNLALLYTDEGSYQKAEPLFLRALAVSEKTLGKENPVIANTLTNLAELYRKQGSYQKAELLLQHALGIQEKALGKENPGVAHSLSSLALLYSEQGNYQKAESLYQHVLEIREKMLGKEHPDVAKNLNNLAELYRKQGSYQKAESLHQRALEIREKMLGKEHPDVANSLNNLAVLYSEQENYQKAEFLHQRALEIREKMLGKEHPDVANSLGNLTALYSEQNDITRATGFLRRWLSVEEHNFTLIYAVGSEQRKQDYAKTFRGSTDFDISLLLQQAPKNSEVARLVLTAVLRRKGRVLDAVSNNVQTLRSQLAAQPETQQLFDQWVSVQQQLAALVYRESEKQTAQTSQTRFNQLEVEKERLEEAISTRSALFRQATQPVELTDIQAKIPTDAALVEIVQYQPFNHKAKATQQRGKPRYGAAVLHSQGEPKWVDLGDAAAINKSVTNLKNAISTQPYDDGTTNPLQQVKQFARTLDQQLMAPIRPLLGNAQHLLLSPDGQLTLIPFEVLQDEQGNYLIQRYAFSYLTSGRDLLQFPWSAKSRSAPVVFADIDYDQQQTLATAPAAITTRGTQNRRSADLANLKFPPLAATLQEAQAIKAAFPDTKVLQGQQATETALKQLHGESILHLATHGFFIPDQPVNLNTKELNQPQTVKQLENPLLRSGIALAGFNDRQQATFPDDGVLTALEVAGLDLQGTQLVVLSACETGVGDVAVGEGVYGLRRALVIAGSQTQVLSLWEVSDAKTKDLMMKYYQKLKAGQGRHEALRQAQLELLKEPDYQHPYYWASFVPSGDWTPLKF